jgi:hypothetical protein
VLRLIAGILGIYGCYLFAVRYPFFSRLHVVLGTFCLVGAVALWMKRPWSRYIVYTVATLFAGYWFWMISQVWEKGWPFNTAIQSAVSLAPGILMVSVAVGSMVVVHKAFKNVR